MPRSSSSKEQVKFLSSLRWWEPLFPPPREHSNRPQGLELVRESSRERQQLSSRLPPPREDSSQPQILGLAREFNSKQWELGQGEGPEDHHTRHVTGLLPLPLLQEWEGPLKPPSLTAGSTQGSRLWP